MNKYVWIKTAVLINTRFFQKSLKRSWSRKFLYSSCVWLSNEISCFFLVVFFYKTSHIKGLYALWENACLYVGFLRLNCWSSALIKHITELRGPFIAKQQRGDDEKERSRNYILVGCVISCARATDKARREPRCCFSN